MFLKDLAQAAVDHCQINKDVSLLVGVSGGADSLALIIGLHTLGYKLVVGHLDHALRPSSAQDADFVQHLAESYNIPFVGERIDIRKTADSGGQSLEEAARHQRYNFLFQQARAFDAQAVAVAHHADDQVETVIMHLLRGAALSGLSGMAFKRVIESWDRDIPLVRPMLGIWRDAINEFISQIGLEPRIDVSNEDTTYYRNRIRHQLIPQLETYNPQIRPVLWRMADVLGEEDHYLEKLTVDAWERCAILQEEDQVIFDRGEFVQLPPALQRRVFRHAMSLLRTDVRDFGYDVVTRGLTFVREISSKSEMDLVSRLQLVKFRESLIIKTWSAELPDDGLPLLSSAQVQAELGVNKAVELRHHWRIEAELIHEVPKNIITKLQEKESSEAWLDFDALEMPLLVRGRTAGERWQPLGMTAHSQKLKDFLINQKIPEHLRDIWPIVCSEDQIAWVVGLRPSDVFKVTSSTKRILRIFLIQNMD